jgi:hypothetical protein
VRVKGSSFTEGVVGAWEMPTKPMPDERGHPPGVRRLRGARIKSDSQEEVYALRQRDFSYGPFKGPSSYHRFYRWY